MPAPKMIPVTLAALRLGLSRERVIRMVTMGKLKGDLVDGRWMVDLSALPASVASGAAPRERQAVAV